MHAFNPMHVLKVVLLILMMMSLSMRESVAAEPLIISNEEDVKSDVHDRAKLFLEYILDSRLSGQMTAYYCKNGVEALVFVSEEVDRIVSDSEEYYDLTVKGIERVILERCSGGI